MPRFIFLLVVVFGIMSDLPTAEAQKANYDESKIPKFDLPDPLEFLSGEFVSDKNQWPQRRAEILELFSQHVYGFSPTSFETTFQELESSSKALGGKAIRKQVKLTTRIDDLDHSFELLIYLPPKANHQAVPIFVGLNFRGNHTISKDTEIRLTNAWVPNDKRRKIENNQANDSSRGASSGRWPIAEILKRGYGVATIYAGDLDPDFDDKFENGIHRISKPETRTKESWGTIAAWAFGLSRAMDYFETQPLIDETKVAVLGHSRLGKTALWAGAQDDRFAIVISNNSGCGGAALSRRGIGETVARINQVFPHWFCEQFRTYDNNEQNCPVDQHLLIAACAPRPVYVASASEDKWADPRGELLSAYYASPVYEKLFDLKGLPALKSDEWGKPILPQTNTPISGTIGYHLRQGRHNLTGYDWEQFMCFADKHFEE